MNAALLAPMSASGREMAKASGCLLRWRDRLLVLTNWHVVTGKRWVSPAERLDEPNKPDVWVSKFEQYSPNYLRVSARIGSYRRLLQTLSLQSDPEPEDDFAFSRNAWEPNDWLFQGWNEMPRWDLVCMELTRNLSAQETRLEEMWGAPVRLGYDLAEVGRDYGLAETNQVFVVGYPSTIGNRPSDPPVWTSGTIATDPSEEWDGPRFLIDSGTRKGQSGSPVITYEPAGGGLPSRQQLIGVYSGRIEEGADIGSVWPLEELIDDLARHPIVARFATVETDEPRLLA